MLSAGQEPLSPGCRALLTSKAMSICGDQLARVAVALLVLHQTHSVALAAVAFAASLIPGFVGATFLAGVGDRQSRRSVLIVGDAGRALVIVGLAIPHQPVWLVLCLVGLVSLLDGPCAAARAALLKTLNRGTSHYQRATSVDEALSQTGQAFGYLIGGSIVLLLGITNGLLLDAATFAVSGVLIAARVPRDQPPPAAAAAGPPGSASTWPAQDRTRQRRLIADSAVGWHALLAPTCRPLILRTWLMTAATVAPEGVAVAWATHLGHGPFEAGLLLAANPIGAVAGLIFLTVRKPANTAQLRGWLLALSLLPLIACAGNPSLLLACALVAVSGAGMTYSTLARVAFAEAVPDSERARAFGIASSGLMLSQGLGILLVGALAGPAGAPTAVAAAAVAAALLCLVVGRERARPSAPDKTAALTRASSGAPQPPHRTAAPLANSREQTAAVTPIEKRPR